MHDDVTRYQSVFYTQTLTAGSKCCIPNFIGSQPRRQDQYFTSHFVSGIVWSMQKMVLFLHHITIIPLLVVFFNTGSWKGIEGESAGRSDSLMTTASPDAFGSVPTPTGPAPDSFFLSTLHRNCSPHGIPNNGPRWKDEIHTLTQRFMSPSNSQKYSCKNRCGVEQRNASVSLADERSPRCFCDKLCDEFGDCCFDFDVVCRKHVNSQTSLRNSNRICYELGASYHGYVFLNKCPKKWKEISVRQKCQDEDQNDLLRKLPVFDVDKHVTYKNIFCARCNGAENTRYWKIKFNCKTWFNVTTYDLRNNFGLLHKKCSVDKKPQDLQLNFLKRCIPRFQDCLKISEEKNESYCQTECLRYAFPVCSFYKATRFRNPQCALCNGFKPRDLISDCTTGIGGLNPSLTILFDFSSTSKYSITVDDKQEGVVKSSEQTWSCSNDEVYDPYAGSCKKIMSSGSHNGQIPSKYNESQEWSPNCTAIAFNKTDYVQLSNGSVYLKPHNKVYNNISYTIRDNRLLLCVNFSRNVTRLEKEEGKYVISKTPASLQLISSIGCIVSMVSLVLLLITYFLFAELRNLPGKIIINLALSLLLYQSVFFSAVKHHDQDTCLAVAVLLHFFVLTSFTWMNVMAYDVHRIFTISDGLRAVNQQENYNRRLMKYCLYAWGSPAVVVFVCVIVDHVKKGSIGYVMGATWILGIAANLKALSFLWYPYVVLNSLQGLFIFLSFAVSGRALELYKSKLTGFQMNLTSRRERTCTIADSCDIQDTSL
ncbi:hypothetical protein ACROYT_G023670 [Oculina patagonica]